MQRTIVSDGKEPYISFISDDGVCVTEGDIILNDDGCHKVYGIVRLGKYGITTEIEAAHYGFYVEWQDDGANEWSKWWRQDILFWLSQKNISYVGHISNHPDLLEVINGENDIEANE